MQNESNFSPIYKIDYYKRQMALKSHFHWCNEPNKGSKTQFFGVKYTASGSGFRNGKPKLCMAIVNAVGINE